MFFQTGNDFVVFYDMEYFFVHKSYLINLNLDICVCEPFGMDYCVQTKIHNSSKTGNS